MKKLVVVSALVLVIILGVVLLATGLNGIVKAAIESLGSKATGASVTVRDVDI